MINLTHVHLPKLEDAGLIAWNRSTGTIMKGPAFEQVSPLIELLQAHQDALPDGWP